MAEKLSKGPVGHEVGKLGRLVTAKEAAALV
jgi:hypothetical protein